MIYLDDGPVAKSDRVESCFSGPTEVKRIGLVIQPDARAARQIFGIGRDSGRFARAGPVDVLGFARRKHNLTIQKKPGLAYCLSLSFAYHESSQSWRELLVQLKRLGLSPVSVH
jgi:hypothetical protein